MPQDILKVGLVGAGGIGGVHAAAYRARQDARIVAIADPRGRAVFEAAAADYIGGESALDASTQVFSTLEELLGQAEVDIIDICAPTPTHLDLALAALESGKHVLLEKPMGRDAEESRRILKAAREAPGVFMVAHCLRFWPAYEFLYESCRSGRFGAYRRGEFERYCIVPEGSHFLEDPGSGGAILDLHIHDVDTALWILGKPRRLQAFGCKGKQGCHNFVNAYWDHGDGAVTRLQAGWPRSAPMPFRMRYHVEFDDATVVMDSASESGVTVVRRGEASEIPSLSEEDGYAREIGYFLDCVRRGSAPERCPAVSSMMTVEMIEREIESIEAGKSVELQ